MKKPEIKDLKCIEMVDMIDTLHAREYEALGLTLPLYGNSGILPDGREDIKARLWAWFRQNHHGNQEFGNDRYYRVSFEADENGSLYEPDLSADEKIVCEYAKDAVNDDGDTQFLLFYISW